MRTQFIEATQQGFKFNWGKFMVGRFDQEEWERLSALPEADLARSWRLLQSRGWTPNHVLVLDLETGEGAIFYKGSTSPSYDLNEKHQVWVCPMFEPFLNWLLAQEFDDVSELPRYVELDTPVAAMAGYRRGREESP